ncbi:mycothiol system anti-sigma-R factor [Saccharomonospora viridis]|jgi:mycothiol system anti-sigma-R factor|uniref:Anti-sigma factor, TIGR02949 family n=2 Tax=Saccharomonospora viridis TaxID=1852 RepID=C7MXX1_SACVD|nr:mycothiol system anti-sigma-R factor [Saccharomonospora viridis]ACU98049.1 anti-sigma factor, TIGR02949 family [Saccharomonospora viridis DSM 43017]KHF46029.1 anti-sigma factor [Saccharomonospora viridis]SFP36990.1 mycothiol system anti-sigma-R factor [Saccharomonospora viridis]
MTLRDGSSGSGERSDKVSCDDALAEIYLLLDKECTPERDAELRRHIEDCPPCLEEYGIDEQIKQLLARKCGGEHAPAELKHRLQESIRRTVAERSGQSLEETELRLQRTTEPPVQS